MRHGFNVHCRNTAEQLFEKENCNETVQAEDNSNCKRDIDRIDTGWSEHRSGRRSGEGAERSKEWRAVGLLLGDNESPLAGGGGKSKSSRGREAGNRKN